MKLQISIITIVYAIVCELLKPSRKRKTISNFKQSSKKLFFHPFILFVLISSNGFTQDENSWTEIGNNQGVKVFSKVVSCENPHANLNYKYVVHKVTNTTNSPVDVFLEFKIHFDQGCNGCVSNNETSMNLSLEAQGELEGSCQSLGNRLSYFIENPSMDGGWIFSNSEVIISFN